MSSAPARYVFIATSVRFFAFNFRMTLRTWTFTVLKPMFNSLAIILLDLPCWIARTTESSRLVSIEGRGKVVDGSIALPVCYKQTVRWDIGAARQNETHHLDSDLKSHGHRNVSLRPTPDSSAGQVHVIGRGKSDNRVPGCKFRQVL